MTCGADMRTISLSRFGDARSVPRNGLRVTPAASKSRVAKVNFDR